MGISFERTTIKKRTQTPETKITVGVALKLGDEDAVILNNAEGYGEIEILEANPLTLTAVVMDKKLYNWEECGAIGGRSLLLYEEDWIDTSCSAFWAPEVIQNPHDGKYYMYFTAIAKLNISPDISSEGTNDVKEEYYKDRMFLGVAVSDTPVGPFVVMYDIDKTTGNRIPTMNFQKVYNTDYFIRTLDANPFFDEDGNFYLYFE